MNPVYGDLVCEIKRIVGNPSFSDQLKKNYLNMEDFFLKKSLNTEGFRDMSLNIGVFLKST